MTLDQFIAHMQTKLKEFEDNWRKENDKDPEIYPMSFADLSYWEQQMAYWLSWQEL